MRTLLMAMLLAATPVAPPATTENTDLLQITDFRPLFEERERRLEELRVLQTALDELSAKTRNLPPVDTLERDAARTQRELEKAKAKKPPDEAAIESLTRYAETTAENLTVAKNALPVLQARRAEYDRAARRLFAVEQRIASLFDGSRDVNKFRTNVTFTFGVLVFIVIVGFYVIAWNIQGVATTIFSGAMGMQFVTLFLIVIAIILFGIMGTLEGKELAALLGGLSGYILGRADGLRPASKTQPETSA